MRAASLAICLLFTCCPVCTGEQTSDREVRRTPIVKAVEKVRGAVVNISTERVIVHRSYNGFFGPGGDIFDRFFDDFFRDRRRDRVIERRKVEQPLGSGCLITADGLVVTNEHVVRRATNIKLSLHTGETFEAELLAADPEEDLALLRAKSDRPFKAIPMGVSSDLMLGETVIALGNPFGFENSVTTGIVSAVNREVKIGSGRDEVQYRGLIQTSALINPGNSGGPLVNVLGELIGINTAVVNQAQGIGFAIAIDRAREKLAPLLATRKVSKAWLGVSAVTVKGRAGTRIVKVNPKGSAREILKAGDVILKFDGKPVRDRFDLALTIAQHKPNDQVRLWIARDGREQRVRLKLVTMPETAWPKVFAAKCGIDGQDLTPALARQLGARVGYGVIISGIRKNGSAADSGLKPGDVIIQVGAHAVRNLRDAGEAVMHARPGQQILIVIVRGRYKAFTRIMIAKSPGI